MSRGENPVVSEHARKREVRDCVTARFLPSGDNCDESRAWGFPHGAGSGRGQLHVSAVNVARLSARGPALPRGPVHGQLRPLRPVPGLPATARIPGTSWHLHATLAFSPQPSQPVGTQSCFAATRYVTISHLFSFSDLISLSAVVNNTVSDKFIHEKIERIYLL